MKINEKVEEMRSELIKKVMEVEIHSEEEAIKQLEEFGLDDESSTKLLIAYRDAKNAKNIAESFWDTALQNRTGAEPTIDVAKAQQDEFDTRTQFDNINEECSLQVVLNQVRPEEVDDELLSELCDYGIKEEDIHNPALRVIFHYYNESKSKDIQRENDLKKVQEYSIKIGSKMTNLESQLKEERAQNEILRKDNATLRSSFEKLQKQFKDRIVADEKYYQVALAQIAALKEKVKQLQERGILKTIGAKLFRKKRKELPEVIDEIPSTLHNTSAEKMGLRVSDEKDMLLANIKKEASTRTKTINRDANSSELQQ